jgi:hypothetical protein
MNRSCSFPVKAVLLAFALSAHVFPQSVGTIVGTVTDPSGAAVAGAKVSAVEAETGVSRQALTDSSGSYTLPGLRPTTYVLSVEAQGFGKFTQSKY